MTDIVIKVIDIFVSGLIPILIFIFGMRINHTLERNRAVISKERDWQNLWAGKFLDEANEFSTTISAIAVGISQVVQINHEKLPDWEDKGMQKHQAVLDSLSRIQYLDWDIQNYIQFAPRFGPMVKSLEKQLLNLVGDFLKTKQADLEVIRRVQFEFNNSVRLAHAEILEIPPTR